MYGKFSSLEIDSEDLAIYIAKYNNFLLEVHLDYFGKETQRYLEVYVPMVVDLCLILQIALFEMIKRFLQDSMKMPMINIWQR